MPGRSRERGSAKVVVAAALAAALVLLFAGWTLAQRANVRRLQAEAERCELELRRLEYVFRKDEELRYRSLDLAARLESLGIAADVSTVRESRIPVPPHPSRPPDGGWPSRAAVASWQRYLDACNARAAAGQSVERGLIVLERTVAALMVKLEQAEAGTD